MSGFECSFAVLDVVGDALRLEVRQFPFTIAHHSATLEERAALIEAVHRHLLAQGLVQDGRFAPELETALNVFARGRLAIAMVGNSGQAQHVALAAADDRDGVVAVQHGESIRFELVHPDAIVRGLVGVLPALRPGPGSSITVMGAAPTRVRRSTEDDFAEFSVTSSVRGWRDSSAGQQEAAEEIMRRPRLGGGYFLVTSRSRNGQETQLGTLSWLDTDAGRYAVIPTNGGDGRPGATYTPADLAGLDRQLTRILHSQR